MKKLVLSALAAFALVGCATHEVVYTNAPPPAPEPAVYYGWYGSYYGYYYWDGPTVIFGCPAYGWHGWHGHYYNPGHRYVHPPHHR